MAGARNFVRTDQDAGPIDVTSTAEPVIIDTALIGLRYALTETNLAALALREVVLDEPVPLGESPEGDLRWLRMLREFTSYGVRLRWTIGGIPYTPLHVCVHLVPPTDGVDPATTRYSRDWAARYRYGTYYYRCGPSFVTVRDVRPEREMRRLVIEDGFEHFLAMANVTRLDELSQDACEAVPDAVEADLALVAAGRLLLLPYRMRHWPVPYVGV